MAAEPTPIHTDLTEGAIPFVVNPPTAPAPLTQTERSAFLGLQARHRAIVQAFNEEERAILTEVEARLGLPPGAIGTTHTVDPQTWTVRAMAPEPSAPDTVAADAVAE